MGYVTAVPHPRSEAPGSARAGRLSLAVALLSGALGAAVALLATRQQWSQGTATVAGGAFPLTAKGSDVTGVPAASVDALSHTAWPYVAVVGGVLILVAGLLALRYGRLWPAMSGRYERGTTPQPRRKAPAVDPDRPEDLWKALDRGEDPTGA